MSLESGFAEIGDARLYYELAGRGQPFVLIHAGVADSRQWNHEFAHFAQTYRVLRYDMRGFGKSHPVEGNFSNMGDLTALLAEVGFNEPLVIIGCSMGGGLAMDFALANPPSVRALVLVGAGPSGLSLDVPSHPKVAEAEQAYKAGDLDRAAELETQILFDGMGRTPKEVDAEMRKLALEMNLLGLDHDARRLGKRLPDADIPAAERLGELEIPVLIIVGEHDLPFIQAAADHMVEKLPHARKVIIEDAAHLPNLDHPLQFQSAVKRFLDEIA